MAVQPVRRDSVEDCETLGSRRNVRRPVPVSGFPSLFVDFLDNPDKYMLF